MALPLMQKATAVWLVENTSLTFRQIATFCGLHELEISGIADGEVAQGIRGMDPVSTNQLTREEIENCETNADRNLKLMINPAAKGEKKRRGPKYTPLSKRQDKPSAILWLVKFHPEFTDGQVSKLVGTTKNTIQSIRQRSHWNINNIQPIDPVALGLCKQVELDIQVKRSSKKNVAVKENSNDENQKILSTDDSLA